MEGQKEGEDFAQLELLRNIIIDKLQTLEHKRFNQKSISDFSLAFHVFLLKYLGVNYEFTDDELVHEIEKRHLSATIKQDIMTIASLLAQIKYEDKQISKEEFNLLTESGKNLVNYAIDKKEKKRTLEKVEKSALENVIVSLKEKFIGMKKEAFAGRHSSGYLNCEEHMTKSRQALSKSSMKMAHENYNKAREFYLKLSVEEKKIIHERLSNLYESVLKARKVHQNMKKEGFKWKA